MDRHEQVSEFPVTGGSVEDVRERLLSLRPRAAAAPAAATEGLEAWTLSWRWQIERGLVGCGVTFVYVRLDLEHLQPALRSSAPAVREAWAGWMERLRKHQAGHDAIGEQAARAIIDALRALPARPACIDVDIDARSTAASVLKRFQQEDRAYEEREPNPTFP